jgi:methionyl-tRNA formyltransferase
VYLNKVTNIVVCCNNEIAFPAISQLAQNGVLKAVVVPERNKEVYQMLQQFLAGSTIELLRVNKKNLVETIKNLVESKNVSYCWLMTFSYILPKALLDLLPGGFINFHYGILPQYRGANPILSHMLQNETHSGLTVHIMDEQIDTGPMLLQHKIPIEDRDTFGTQCKKLGMLGAAMAQQLLQLIQQGLAITPVVQDESVARYFKKPVAKELMINWETMSSRQVVRMIMACNPWNKGAGTMINNNIICLLDAETISQISLEVENLPPGTIVGLDKKEGLQIVCSDNKIIRVNIIYTTDGFFTPDELFVMGIKLKDRFITV